MSLQNFNTKIINAVYEHISSDKNPTDAIMDILNMERKAAQRRIAGEVALSLQEAAILARALNFSLDKVLHDDDKANFLLSVSTSSNHIKAYEEKMDHYLEMYKHLYNDTNSSVCMAYNMIPSLFYLKYDSLSKFMLLKWNYRFCPTLSNTFSYREFSIPEATRRKQLQLITYAHQVGKSIIIINNSIFADYIDDVQYFCRIGKLTVEDVCQIRDDLLNVLSDMEQIALSGSYQNGNKVELYLSDVNFESSFGYLESSIFKFSTFLIHFINAITTLDPQVKSTVEEWIETLKISSTYLTGSGEIHRRRFIMKQQKMINQMGKHED